MMPPKVLIIDKMHDSIVEMLAGAGFEADYRPDLKRADILRIIGGYGGLIVRSKTQIDAELLEAAANLRFVARAGAGIDQIDYQELTKKNVKLINAPEGNRDALGEHTTGMLLSILHRIHAADREVKSGIWKREANRGWELKGKTVGIYGYGFMGSAFAEKLKGFGCDIITYDKYKTIANTKEVRQVDLDTFKKETEILSIHVPLTSETHFIFDQAYLAEFTNLRIVLNTARGEVLRLSALIDLLQAGKLLGAGLDVLENEKLDRLTAPQKAELDKLAAIDTVVLTPHVAGWTFESYRKINEVIISKLQKEGLAHVG